MITEKEYIDALKIVKQYEKDQLEIKKINYKVEKGHWGVHETHCCSIHGCKYGYEDCPVVLGGLIKQKYKCEDCDDDEKYNF